MNSFNYQPNILDTIYQYITITNYNYIGFYYPLNLYKYIGLQIYKYIGFYYPLNLIVILEIIVLINKL
jgi:hypothetical protein